MIKAALVLEGGALRSLYTSGVLDVFMEKEMEFECVIGVSAGALNATNYITKQTGRSVKINILHSNDSDYYGLRQLIFRKSAFNFDYLFRSPINDLYPYNEELLETTRQKFLIGATDCNTGKAVYFEKYRYAELIQALQASSSMPLMSEMVEVDGITCLDGAMSEPVSIDKAISEGYNKIVVVLTRDYKFNKTKANGLLAVLSNIKYRKYPELINALHNIPEIYNSCIRKINKMEQEKKIFVFRPACEIKIKPMEKDVRKLFALYCQGRDDAHRQYRELFEYLQTEG